MTNYLRRGYRRTTVYLKPDLFLALKLRAINERKNMTEIINEAIEQYLNEAPKRLGIQAPERSAVQAPSMLDSQQPVSSSSYMFESQDNNFLVKDNPWIGIIRSRYNVTQQEKYHEALTEWSWYLILVL